MVTRNSMLAGYMSFCIFSLKLAEKLIESRKLGLSFSGNSYQLNGYFKVKTSVPCTAR